MDHRTTRTLAAAAFALILGACDDAPTAPAAPAAAASQPARTVSASGATLIPNTVKYRDNGGKPARGRSGAAALEALALLSKDGRTVLEYRAVAADPWQWWVHGTLERAQVKALDGDGAVMFTFNENALNTEVHRTEFGSLVRGQSLQVQANVTGIDPHRTDVVTVTERIKLLPDLAVRMDLSPRVAAGQPVPVHATVSELNGDVGASAECRLLVDGAQRDWAWGVWVDAGDVVTCAFTHVFSAGTHQVQVQVGEVHPADWDDANNLSAAVQVEAVAGPAEFSYSAGATAIKASHDLTWTAWWHNPSTQTHGEWQYENRSTEDTESAYMSGWINRALSGEVSLEVSQSSGGRVIHSDAWTDYAGGGYFCTSRDMQSTSFFLCSYGFSGWAYTSFTYYRYAGAVTYHSRNYAREWDYVTGEDIYYYDYNDSYANDAGPTAGYGDDYSFHVRVAAGDMVLTADSHFPLERSEYSIQNSFCYTYQEWWDTFTAEDCLSWDDRETLVQGYDYHYGG
jgi:hypothetical protein